MANTVDMDVRKLRTRDLVGQVVDGRYEVIEKLGVGGMGTVYRARHVQIRKQVALKVLLPELVHSGDMFKRFRQEAKAASSIGHPNIVEISDFGTLENGAPFFVMEYLAGIDLAGILKKEGPLEWRRAFGLCVSICSALEAAHKLGIVHRDVKPDNFFVVQRDDRDFVKVLDFGIAKLLGEEGSVVTRTGLFVGTPEYMSPEQAEGLELDGRVDVYGMGIMLYQLVTGRLPFRGKDEFEILNKHLHAKPQVPSEHKAATSLPKRAEAVILKALAKKREERQQSAAELGAELQAAIEQPDGQTPSPQVDPSMSAEVSPVVGVQHGSRLPPLLLGVVLGTAIAGIVMFLLMR